MAPSSSLRARRSRSIELSPRASVSVAPAMVITDRRMVNTEAKATTPTDSRVTSAPIRVTAVAAAAAAALAAALASAWAWFSWTILASTVFILTYWSSNEPRKPEAMPASVPSMPATTSTASCASFRSLERSAKAAFSSAGASAAAASTSWRICTRSPSSLLIRAAPLPASALAMASVITL